MAVPLKLNVISVWRAWVCMKEVLSGICVWTVWSDWCHCPCVVSAWLCGEHFVCKAPVSQSGVSAAPPYQLISTSQNKLCTMSWDHVQAHSLTSSFVSVSLTIPSSLTCSLLITMTTLILKIETFKTRYIHESRKIEIYKILILVFR